MTAATQSGDRRRKIIVGARMFCVLACPGAIILAVLVPFVTQKNVMHWLSVVFLLILAAITLSYARGYLERATPPLPQDDEDVNSGVTSPAGVPDTRMGPLTTGAIFGFIWGPPP